MDLDCTGAPNPSLSKATYTFVGEGGDDLAGASVQGVGDVDGDGRDDVFIGAPYARNSRGAAYLVLSSSLGSTTSIDLSTADYVFVGDSSADHAGSAVARVGDVDADGLDDLVVGAPFTNDWAGASYLVLGASLGGTAELALAEADASFHGESTDQFSGIATSAGDVDGDGRSDLLIGAVGDQSGGGDPGRAYLILSGL